MMALVVVGITMMGTSSGVAWGICLIDPSTLAWDWLSCSPQVWLSGVWTGLWRLGAFSVKAFWGPNGSGKLLSSTGVAIMLALGLAV